VNKILKKDFSRLTSSHRINIIIKYYGLLTIRYSQPAIARSLQKK